MSNTDTVPTLSLNRSLTTDVTERATGERHDLIQTLELHRSFLRHTAAGLNHEQATRTPTVSALSVGGIVKHVTAVERGWAAFMDTGVLPGMPDDFAALTPDDLQAWADEFRLLPGETLAGVVAEHEAAAARTNELIASLDLDTAHPLPSTPWFEPGSSWTVRRVALHLIAETSQHAGHADIIRETIDGQKTMG